MAHPEIVQKTATTVANSYLKADGKPVAARKRPFDLAVQRAMESEDDFVA